MPIRNPFRRPGVDAQEENLRPSSGGANPGFQQVPVNGAKPIEIKEPTEYKLSEINDSGVFMPPSPTERKTSFFGSSRTTSTNSSNHRSVFNEKEPFNISRESFDSYRRSFDISARSPMIDSENRPRISLDSRHPSLQLPRSSMAEDRVRRPLPSANEEGFEEVGLNDDDKKPVKKRGLFARFGNDSDANIKEESRPTSSHHGFHLPGRKRGQSGQGAELSPMDGKRDAQPAAVAVNTQ